MFLFSNVPYRLFFASLPCVFLRRIYVQAFLSLLFPLFSGDYVWGQSAPKAAVETHRALIISGGGSRVSWGAGFAKALVASGKSYKTVGGSSAGALIMSSVILNQFDELEQLFDTITNKNVYNKNPINKRGRIKVLKTIWRTIWGKPAGGDTKNLRKTIEKTFTQQDYDEIQKRGHSIFCITTSLNTSKKQIISSVNTSYGQLLDWICASASVPVLTPPIRKEGQSWVNGGLLDNVPIGGALLSGANEIDVIVLFPKERDYWESQHKIPRISLRTLEIMLQSSYRGSIELGKLMAQMKKGGRLNLYYISKVDSEFVGNVFSFNHKNLAPAFQRGSVAFINNTATLRSYRVDDMGNFIQE